MAKKEKPAALAKEKREKAESERRQGKKAASKQEQRKRNQEPLPQAEGALPQNILPVGERVLGDKNIYIAQGVYRKIHKFTEGKTKNESGGILVGRFLEELGKKNIMVEGFVEARHCEATPQTLTFTHDTWEAVDQEIEKKHKGKSIVGWIHTHPDFGIFLSNYDTFIQENFFKEENQIAYVIDPVRGEEGFYFWVNGKIERCPGFYLYDKTGTPITALHQKEDEEQPEPSAKSGLFSGIQTALLVALSAAVVLLGFQVISLKEQLSALGQSLSQLVFEAREGFFAAEQADQALEKRVAALEQAAGIQGPAPSSASQAEEPSPSAPEAFSEPSPSAGTASPSASPSASGAAQPSEPAPEGSAAARGEAANG